MNPSGMSGVVTASSREEPASLILSASLSSCSGQSSSSTSKKLGSSIPLAPGLQYARLQDG